jgi:hypothetical protein
VPLGWCEGWDPRGVGRDEPDAPVVGRGVGVLELLDVLEVVGAGELWVVDGVLTEGVLTEGVLTEGVLTDGVLTDGVLRDGTLTDGSGDDAEPAGGSAIDVNAPRAPAPSDATNNFLPLDTGISCRVRSPSRAATTWAAVAEEELPRLR